MQWCNHLDLSPCRSLPGLTTICSSLPGVWETLLQLLQCSSNCRDTHGHDHDHFRFCIHDCEEHRSRRDGYSWWLVQTSPELLQGDAIKVIMSLSSLRPQVSGPSLSLIYLIGLLWGQKKREWTIFTILSILKERRYKNWKTNKNSWFAGYNALFDSHHLRTVHKTGAQWSWFLRLVPYICSNVIFLSFLSFPPLHYHSFVIQANTMK